MGATVWMEGSSSREDRVRGDLRLAGVDAAEGAGVGRRGGGIKLKDLLWTQVNPAQKQFFGFARDLGINRLTWRTDV